MMDPRKGHITHKGAQVHPRHMLVKEKRSLSESLADGTSKFFSTMFAKKNGFLSDISSKIENTFAPKTDTISNSSGSEGSATPPATPRSTNKPPPRPPPPKRLPSQGGLREGSGIQRMSSLPSYTRTNSKQEFNVTLSKCGPVSNHRRTTSEERFSVNGMNVSFDEPIYKRRESNASLPVTEITVSDTLSYGTKNSRTRHASEPQPRPTPRTRIRDKANDDFSSSSHNNSCSLAGFDKSKGCDNSCCQGNDHTRSLCNEREKVYFKDDEKDVPADKFSRESANSKTAVQARRMSSGSAGNFPIIDKNSDAGHTASNLNVGERTKHKTPTFATTKRRSNTVDEILFDDYIKPEVDVIIPKEEPPEDLISFEPELKILREINSLLSSAEGSEHVITGTSVDSSDAESGCVAVHRSVSAGSDKSWSSNYSLDSQPDDITLECMEFMKTFVDKIFHNSEDISQIEKAKFGLLCQHSPGRMWFSRHISSQRVHNKKVSECVFFRLMQYFAVCLFECNDADDFSPAKTLMNMCFTFYNEVPSHQGQVEKVFLYMYMRDQPIWHSLRFWNAAYFDAVQCERSRRPMPTNLDASETVSDDKKFQENITFGQLGTFACNMREFGLSRELCLEFLRKQSTIANLSKDQVKLLKENIDRVKDT